MTRYVIGALTVLLLGCAHKLPSPVAHPEDGTQATATERSDTTPAATSSAPMTCSRDLDCRERQLCIRGACVDITADLAECSTTRVHFPFNSAELAPADQAAMERSARCLRADRSLHVSIEGNADERGTEEYNMALGDRRATAVANHLQRLGATPAQVQTVSYGEENPLCAESDEACWSKNRRAAIKPKQGPRK